MEFSFIGCRGRDLEHARAETSDSETGRDRGFSSAYGNRGSKHPGRVGARVDYRRECRVVWELKHSRNQEKIER